MIHVYKAKHPIDGSVGTAIETEGTQLELLKELSLIIWTLIERDVVNEEQMRNVLAAAIATYEPSRAGEPIKEEGMKS